MDSFARASRGENKLNIGIMFYSPKRLTNATWSSDFVKSLVCD